ncbi:hypothetical protein H4S14_001640 [Agrobacterium vitis]|nr:hypothetical protein [Agrobacterium vitis]MBE1437896.1 hypothetical protein [Agrobacterium vitis]
MIGDGTSAIEHRTEKWHRFSENSDAKTKSYSIVPEIGIGTMLNAPLRL